MVVGTKPGLVFREKFKDLWPGSELGVFQVPSEEGRGTWRLCIPNDSDSCNAC